VSRSSLSSANLAGDSAGDPFIVERAIVPRIDRVRWSPVRIAGDPFLDVFVVFVCHFIVLLLIVLHDCIAVEKIERLAQQWWDRNMSAGKAHIHSAHTFPRPFLFPQTRPVIRQSVDQRSSRSLRATLSSHSRPV
jgi:hypothetical protein